MPLFSVSIDVDSLDCYYRIHSLGKPPEALRGVIYRNCIERFASVLDEVGLRGTFFVVAQDVDTERPDTGEGAGGKTRAHTARSAVAALASGGHEIGSHSYSHPYELARLDRATVEIEIGRAHRVIGKAAGRVPRGFRAPGYDLSVQMQAALVARGYLYDSSVFPAPGYYAAKAAVMVAMSASGRESGAVLTNPRALLAPAEPYRPALGNPFRRGDAPMLELPIAVAPFSRIPVIGTSMLLAPRWLRDRLWSSMGRRTHFNFELHAIDLADAETDGLPGALVSRQPDLRVPFAKKRCALVDLLRRAVQTHEVRTLEEAALELAATT